MTLRFTFILFFFTFLSCSDNKVSSVQKASPKPVPLTPAQLVYSDYKDFSSTYWQGKLSQNKPAFVMESPYFFAEFSTEKLGIRNLTWRNGSLNANDLQGLAIPFKITKSYKGKNHQLMGFQDKGNMHNCDLIESGRFFQRRAIRELNWANLPVASNDYLQISAWPGSLNFFSDFKECDKIEWELDLKAFKSVQKLSGTEFQITNKEQQVFVITAQSGRFRLNGKNLSLIQNNGKLAFKITPDSKKLIHQTDSQIKITAQQEKPKQQDITVNYDQELDAYVMDIEHINISKEIEERNKREELIKFKISNQSSQDKQVRLVFQKKPNVGPITGISAILLEKQLPSGHHVQLSKNWHRDKAHKFQGTWYRGFTMLNIPAGKTREFQYLSVNALWKGLPAASHNQLSLTGYKGHRNHLWEQSALGAWGESICYDPEHGLATSITDVRPLMVTSMGKNGSKWSWTNNVGGGEFFSVYQKGQSRPLPHVKVKTTHLRNCPVLTEVNYSSEVLNGLASLSYTASLSRTDDIVRGIYNVEYKILKDMKFDRLVLFQVGADSYNYTDEKEFAVGHGPALIKKWTSSPGGNQYKSSAIKLDQQHPWIAMYKAAPQKSGAGASRGIIIRSWEAQSQGKKISPWARERSVDLGRRKVSITDITLKPEIKELKAGDTIKACFEMVIIPQFFKDYYGPNQGLQFALKKFENDWPMISREAQQNKQIITMRQGEIIRKRPLLIEIENNTAEFSIEKGLAFQALTFTGISTRSKGILEIKTEQGWKKCSQSEFYQSDYNAQKQCWEYSFSMPLPNPLKYDFRFKLQD
jgi:uncharacterized protein YjdB